MKSLKLLSVAVLMLIFQFEGISQVGIGTTEPDASAIFDVTSSEQGMLAPRMTTIQRTAIVDPADGLLVYDIDLSAFFFYDNEKWNELNSEDGPRNNYLLVQSVADLTEELELGGGTRYLLKSNYLYEINGIIIFDFPIELNGAYIKGEDSLEDVIVNGSGQTLFVGTTGGNLKRLTVNGNGQQIFDITVDAGSVSKNFIALACNFVGSTSVGSMSNFNLILFNTGQFLGNTTGLTLNSISEFYATIVSWNANNTGTFIDLNGTFSGLQISNSRVVVDTGETGLDVSSNPVINGSASLAQVTFSGDGTRINGYISNTYDGYNFTRDWRVESQGILLETDDNATGDINLDATVGSGFLTSFIGIGDTSRKKLSGTTTSNNLFRFNSTGDNRIMYDGLKTRSFQVSASLSFQADRNNVIFIFYIAKNGIIQESTKVYRQSGSTGDIGAVSIIGSMELSTDDYIEVWAERYSGDGDLLTVSLNLVAN